MAIEDNIIGVESGGDPNARNPYSSAGGAGQFIDSTWLAMLAAHRPDIKGTPQELLALKNDPQLSREMTAAYAADNGKILQSAGYDANPGNTYLAHFAGPQGAVKVLSADPSTPVSQILGDAAVKSNKFLQGMTAGDLQAWAARKMGGAAPHSQPAQNAPAIPTAPANAIPQQRPPIFAQQQQAQPRPQQPIFQGGGSAPQPAGGSLFGQMPAEQPIQAPPLFYAQRRPVSLDGLRAALQAANNRGPIFRG